MALLLTSQLFQRIKAVIQKHHRAFIVNAFGQQPFPPEVVQDLKAQGLVTDSEVGATNAAYLYGQVKAQLEDPKVAAWSLDKLNAWTARNPIDLTDQERAAASTAQLTAAQYCEGLGNVVDKTTGALLINADHALQAEMEEKIQGATALNIAARETVRQLKSDLGWETEDWARNLDRIAITEKHNAMQLGVADGITRKGGRDALVAILHPPDACPTCLRLTVGPDGHPLIFKLSELDHPGINVGRKQVDWVACVGAIHPHCQGSVVRVPPGWGFNDEGRLVPGGKGGLRAVAREEDEEDDGTEKSLARIHQLDPDVRFVIKADVLNDFPQGVPDQVRYSTNTPADRGPQLSGGGANLQMKLPPRPIGGTNDAAGVAAWLKQGQPFTSVLYRDPHVYEFDQDNPEAIFSINRDMGTLATAHDTPHDTLIPRQMLERQALASGVGPRNTANVGWNPVSGRLPDEPPRAPVQDHKPGETQAALERENEDNLPETSAEEEPNERELEKAGFGQEQAGHKYIHRAHKGDHWVYTYAEKHGGKVEAHPHDEGRLALKVPHVHAEHLAALAGKHGIPAHRLVQGARMTTLPMSLEEAERIHVAETPQDKTLDGTVPVVHAPVAAKEPPKPEVKKMGTLEWKSQAGQTVTLTPAPYNSLFPGAVMFNMTLDGKRIGAGTLTRDYVIPSGGKRDVVHAWGSSSKPTILAVHPDMVAEVRALEDATREAHAEDPAEIMRRLKAERADLLSHASALHSTAGDVVAEAHDSEATGGLPSAYAKAKELRGRAEEVAAKVAAFDAAHPEVLADLERESRSNLDIG